MEDKINVAELLKYCPSGMPLDCAMWDNLYFDRVEDDIIYCYYELDGYRNSTIFCKDGCYSAHKLSKCVIFPKGKTTWAGFVPPVKFKDGDILAVDDTVFIYNGMEDKSPIPGYYVYVIADKNGFFAINASTKKYGTRFATEEEKNILFEAIKNNGYKWYPDTKSLVKLFKPNFKVGDRIRNKTDKYLAERIIKSYVEGIGYFTTINDWVRINDQDNWELVPIKPIFKVGDIIKCKNGTSKLIIMCIKDDRYIVDDDMGGKCGMLYFSTQDNWELVKNIKPIFKVGDTIKKKDDNRLITIKSILDGNYIITTPDLFDNCNLTDKFSFEHQDEYELVKRNKFNYSTIKPFDKVLVRDGDSETWVNAFFGFYDTATSEKYPFVASAVRWAQCIPYEGNEHLLGTTDDCDEHFNIW